MRDTGLVMPPDAFVRAADRYCQRKGITDPRAIFQYQAELRELYEMIAALKDVELI